MHKIQPRLDKFEEPHNTGGSNPMCLHYIIVTRHMLHQKFCFRFSSQFTYTCLDFGINVALCLGMLILSSEVT